MLKKVAKSLGFLAVLASGVLISGLGTTALASTTTSIPVAVTGGSLTLQAPSSPSSFGGLTLNGQVQSLSTALSPWSVTDATGTGYGWSVSVSASPLTEETPANGFASGTSALTLPSGSLSVVGGGTITAGSGATPVSSTGGPTFENVGSPLTSTPFVLLKASDDYGLGEYTITPPSNALSLTIDPSTTEVDSVNYPSQPTPYSSTLTFSLVSGPAPVLQPEVSSVTFSDGANGIQMNDSVITVMGTDLPIYSNSPSNAAVSGYGYNFDNFEISAYPVDNEEGTNNGYVGPLIPNENEWGVSIVSSTPTELQFTLSGLATSVFDTQLYLYLSQSPLTADTHYVATFNGA